LEVGIFTIHLVQKCYAGELILIGIAPHKFRPYLHTGDAVKYNNGSINNAKGRLNLTDKIEVSRGIHYVNLGVFPDSGGGSRVNTYIAIDLFRVVVQSGIAIINPPETIGCSTVKQHRFR